MHTLRGIEKNNGEIAYQIGFHIPDADKFAAWTPVITVDNFVDALTMVSFLNGGTKLAAAALAKIVTKTPARKVVLRTKPRADLPALDYGTDNQ